MQIEKTEFDINIISALSKVNKAGNVNELVALDWKERLALSILLKSIAESEYPEYAQITLKELLNEVK